MALPKLRICLLAGTSLLGCITACQATNHSATSDHGELSITATGPSPELAGPRHIHLSGSTVIDVASSSRLSEDESKDEPQDAPQIKPENKSPVYPYAFQKHHEQTLVKTAPHMLTVAMVIRPKADLREGPGSEYKLLDKILPLHTRLLVIDELGVWKKVLVRHTWESGWVHEQAISKPTASTVPLDLPANILPTVITVQPIKSIRSFPHKKKVTTSVQRGHMFRILRQSAEEILVWYEPTDHVFWVSQSQVK